MGVSEDPLTPATAYHRHFTCRQVRTKLGICSTFISMKNQAVPHHLYKTPNPHGPLERGNPIAYSVPVFLVYLDPTQSGNDRGRWGGKDENNLKEPPIKQCTPQPSVFTGETLK